MKVKGSVKPPMWHVDMSSNNITQVYHRWNFEPYEKTDELGKVSSGWMYDEEILLPTQAMAIMEAEAYDNGVFESTVQFLQTESET